MARMPDGWVVFVEADKLEVRIKESRELVLCKHCKHRYTGNPDLDCEFSGGDDWFCPAGERMEDDDG